MKKPGSGKENEPQKPCRIIMQNTEVVTFFFEKKSCHVLKIVRFEILLILG
jgi:hypothetical protein